MASILGNRSPSNEKNPLILFINSIGKYIIYKRENKERDKERNI